MVSFIRKRILAGAVSNEFAPQIFLVLCVYAVIVSVYTGLFFDAHVTIVRIIISIVLVIAYVFLERSPLGSEALAFLSPLMLGVLLTGGAIYFQGDFLLFTYSTGAAMISLTYMKPRGLAAYIATISVGQAVALLLFGLNLLGPTFTMIYNYLYFMVSVAINILIYIFCKSYTRMLSALTDARNDAYQASLAKGAFLSNMSHEIRTPMNAIIGMTAIGKASSDIDRAHNSLQKIEDASTHLLGVINDVLDMSKIESGKFELSLTGFNFHKMLHRVVDVISFRVDEKKQNFSLYIDDNIPLALVGDDQRLAQIITNLLGNAVKFTPNGGSLRLDAHLLHEEDGVYTLQIKVTDSGIGISEEQQDRLFQPFQQVDSDTSRLYGGTGLGLSICKRLVEMMGGTIWVKSEPGQGSTFAFTAQVKRGDSPDYISHTRELNWEGSRILVLDEDPQILEYVKSIVERHGANCDTMSYASDALKHVTLCPYAICFIDWKVSDMDALDLVKKIKRMHPEHDNIVIAMLSAAEYHDIEESAKRAGIDGFIPKPLFPSNIVDTINGFIGIDREQTAELAVGITVDYTGKCILLAEDIDINREIISILLEPTNLLIDCAENGADAVRMFSDAPEKYDIILMDVQMPEMDGYEATRRIRALDVPKAKDIPIIAMTANVFREDIERCIEAGMNDHIGKPLDIDTALGLINKYLDLGNRPD